MGCYNLIHNFNSECIFLTRMGDSVSMLLDIFPGRNYSGIKLWFKTKRFFHYFNDMYFHARKIKGERVCVHFIRKNAASVASYQPRSSKIL